MWMNWSTARCGAFERKAWSVICVRVALSWGFCSIRSSSACWRFSWGVCSSAARSCSRRARNRAFCTATGRRDRASGWKLASQERSCKRTFGFMGLAPLARLRLTRQNRSGPQVCAEIFHPGIADGYGDGLACEIATQQLQGCGDVGSGGEPGEDTLLAGEAAGCGGGFGVGHGEKTVDVFAAQQSKIGPAVAGALQQVGTTGLQTPGQDLGSGRFDDETADVRIVLLEGHGTAGERPPGAHEITEGVNPAAGCLEEVRAGAQIMSPS